MKWLLIFAVGTVFSQKDSLNVVIHFSKKAANSSGRIYVSDSIQRQYLEIPFGYEDSVSLKFGGFSIIVNNNVLTIRCVFDFYDDCKFALQTMSMPKRIDVYLSPRSSCELKEIIKNRKRKYF